MERLTILTCLACFMTFGCAPVQPTSMDNSEVAGRMESIVRLALDKAPNPLHRSLIERGVVFVDLEDLEVPCVGLRVPTPDSDNRIFLSFTKEWFHQNSDEAVADALINDLGKVLDNVDDGASAK